MVKSYTRICDGCKKEIKKMYDFGVTTLYSQIRIGRGNRFHDYDEKTIYNEMAQEEPDDYDDYGKGYSSDENREFSFCSPQCLINFLQKLYKDTWDNSLKVLKEEDSELNISINEFKKNFGEKIPFFQKIQTMFSKNHFRETALEKIDKEIKRLKKEKANILGSQKTENSQKEEEVKQPKGI